MKVLILAGGSGSRLWPLSTDEYPKQFLKLMDSDISLLQDVFLWSAKMTDIKDIYFLTNTKYKSLVAQQIQDVNAAYDMRNILVEPIKKNTLPPIYYGVMHACKKDDTVVVLPSDQKNLHQDKWITTIKETEKLAKEYIVTFGIRPLTPHTQYGYIKPGESKHNGFIVNEFKEKPDKRLAERYVEKGYLWNSGIFFFHSALFKEEVKKHAPDIYYAFQQSADIDQAYAKIERDVSIDYGLMEKTDKAAVVPVHLGWNDMGNFDSFYEVFEKDQNDNILSHDEIAIKANGNLVISEPKRKVVLIGVDDLIVVENEEALLLCRKSQSHKIKEIAEMTQDYKDFTDTKSEK